MKGIYFAQIDPDQMELGAVKKVHDQVDALKRCEFEIQLVCAVPMKSGLRKSFLGKGFFGSLPFLPVFARYERKQEYLDCDFYYFRFSAADYPFVCFLKWLKTNNPGAKILIEFPDFPSTYWMGTVFHLGLRLKDIRARKHYKHYVDYFVLTIPGYKEIYEVPVIYMQNGIKVERIPARVPMENATDEIHAIAVATMFPFHGFDRFLLGMSEYYKKNPHPSKKIVLHLVGEGPGKELLRYREITHKEKLEPYVVFEGEKTGDELTKVFDRCSIAVCSLGMFRNGFNIASSLKTREYLARGIPLVSGCQIDILENVGFPYELRFSNDESIIDIDKVISFHESVYRDRMETEVIDEIRQFAFEHCDSKVVMRQVIEGIMS